MPARLEGKVALVTGGAAGIGRTSALAFAREGAKVIVADINEPGGQETARLIPGALFVKTDVTRSADVEALVKRTLDAFGRLDCAHNNAGVEGMRERTADYDEADWDRTLAVNLKGIWLCMKHEIPVMQRQGGGAIVNTASVAGLVGVKKSPAYVASKHGIVGLTKAAALEYARDGIRVNVVCPGIIDTKMLARAIDDGAGALGGVLKPIERMAARSHLESKAPMDRLGTPEEVAEAVVWLCSDAASFVTGHALVADGGFTAQ